MSERLMQRRHALQHARQISLLCTHLSGTDMEQQREALDQLLDTYYSKTPCSCMKKMQDKCAPLVMDILHREAKASAKASTKASATKETPFENILQAARCLTMQWV